jgi:hypothetical protein
MLGVTILGSERVIVLSPYVNHSVVFRRLKSFWASSYR